jgi:hypothetical protein
MYILIPKTVQFWRNLVWTDCTHKKEKKGKTRETPVAEAVNPVGHQLPMQRGANTPSYTYKYLRGITRKKGETEEEDA